MRSHSFYFSSPPKIIFFWKYVFLLNFYSGGSPYLFLLESACATGLSEPWSWGWGLCSLYLLPPAPVRMPGSNWLVGKICTVSVWPTSAHTDLSFLGFFIAYYSSLAIHLTWTSNNLFFIFEIFYCWVLGLYLRYSIHSWKVGNKFEFTAHAASWSRYGICPFYRRERFREAK